MINVVGFGHINIVVDSIDVATDYYQRLLGAKPIQYFPHFKNKGFARSAGFLDDPSALDISINFLKIPCTDIYLELMCYHHPRGKQVISTFAPNDLGGVRHLCLRVENIQLAFERIKHFDGASIISTSPNYKPCKLDAVTADDFIFFDEATEFNQQAKAQSAAVSCEISFFYFTDQYGVLWELEEAPESVEDPALNFT